MGGVAVACYCLCVLAFHHKGSNLVVMVVFPVKGNGDGRQNQGYAFEGEEFLHFSGWLVSPMWNLQSALCDPGRVRGPFQYVTFMESKWIHLTYTPSIYYCGHGTIVVV